MAIDPGVYFLWAALLLLLPLNWLGAAVLSVAVHELCHLAALCCFGKPPQRLRVGITGCTLDVPDLRKREDLICALAGPVGSFVLLLLARDHPRIALCALFHGAFNLLPLYPLDGGRVLQAAASMALPPRAAQGVCTGVKYLTLLILGWFLLASRLRQLCLYAALLALGRYLAGKIPCKPPKLRVQ